jgi:ABC-type transport system involved in multi-copper enzyme maturation permease subunit
MQQAQARKVITQAEYRHQRQAQADGRRWWRWLSRGTYVAMLLLSCVVYFGEWLAALFQVETRPLHEALEIGLPILLILVLGMQLLLIFRTVAAAASSISREERGATWDLLLLTGVTSRAIILGKWWATMRAQWRGWLLLIPVRIGLVTFYAAVVGQAAATYMLHDLPSRTVVPPSPLGLLLIIPLVTVFTFANATVMAAIGLLGSALVRRAGVAMALAVAVLIGLLVGTVLLGVGVTRINYETYEVSSDIEAYTAYTFRVQLLASMILTGVDNGTLIGTPLVSSRLMQLPADPRQMAFEISDTLAASRDFVQVLPTTVTLSLLLGALLVAVLLSLASAALRRRGVLASPR